MVPGLVFGGSGECGDEGKRGGRKTYEGADGETGGDARHGAGADVACYAADGGQGAEDVGWGFGGLWEKISSGYGLRGMGGFKDHFLGKDWSREFRKVGSACNVGVSHFVVRVQWRMKIVARFRGGMTACSACSTRWSER